MACYNDRKDVVQLILQYAELKEIEIPTSPRLCWPYEIKDIIRQYHARASYAFTISEQVNNLSGTLV